MASVTMTAGKNEERIRFWLIIIMWALLLAFGLLFPLLGIWQPWGWRWFLEIILPVPVVFFLSGFFKVAEERRYITELFGAYFRTVEPGLRWRCPFVETLRTWVSTQERQLPLFRNGEEIDFTDGTAKPKGAGVYVRLNILDDPYAPYRMVYVVERVAEQTISLVENALRGFLSGMTVDEGLKLGKGDVLDEMSNQVPDTVTALRDAISPWGWNLCKIVLPDFKLGDVIVKAREAVLKEEAATKVAVYRKKVRAQETIGFTLEQIAMTLGMKDLELQELIVKNEGLMDRFLDFCQQTTLERMALDKGALSRIVVTGAQGSLEQTILNTLGAAIQMLQKGGGQTPENLVDQIEQT